MTPKKIALTVFILLFLFIGGSSFFYVDQRVQALVLQFGEPVKLIKEPGLQFKIPLIQDAIFLDSRLLNLDPQPEDCLLYTSPSPRD